MMPRGAASTRGTLICRIWPNSCRRRVASPGMIRLVVWVMEHMGETESFSVRTENWEQKKNKRVSRLYRTPPLFTRLCGEESTCGEWQRLRLSTAWAIQLGSWTDGAVCSSGSISSNIFVAWEVPRNGCMPAAGPTTAHNAGETIHGKYPLTLERKQNLRCGKPAWCSNELFSSMATTKEAWSDHSGYRCLDQQLPEPMKHQS